MKILYIFDHFDITRNYRDVSYAKEMAKKHDVYVLVSKEEDKKESIKKWQRVTVIRKSAPICFRGFVPWLNDYKKIIKKINPDIIHTFEGIKISTSVMGCWAKKRGYPVVYDQETRMVGGWGRLTRWKYFLGARYFEKRIVKKADLIRTMNPAAKEYLIKNLKINPNKISSSTLGYDKEIFYPSKKLREKSRRELGVEKKEYLIVTTGSLVELKKIELIIEAFKKIQNRNIRLLVIGKLKEDYYQKLLRKYEGIPGFKIENKFLNLDELNELYNGADLLVWPHVTISYFEALATKTPVLVPYFKATSHLEGVKGVFFYGKNKKIFDRYERIINDNVRVSEC